MNVLIRGLLSSFFILIYITATAQLSVLDDKYFQQYGGVEILINKSDFSPSILDLPGVTIDHGHHQASVQLYMNQQGYDNFINLQIPHSVIPRSTETNAMKTFSDIRKLKSGGECLPPLDYYPTYEAYESLMYDFESQYPEICRIINIGTLASGRKILVAHIGDNLDAAEEEPNFFYTSTMHGDETGGYPSMINLINDLLCNYGDDTRLTHLVDNINIYINPLANPNGTYRSGNHTVDGAIRFNSTFSDLNRNFPDPDDGDHPDNRPYQEETEIFMAFAENYNIHLSCNIHGGAEVANYPWDTYEHMPADVDWWVEQCRAYADTVHQYSANNYFRGFENGITNGFAWYEVRGGRQDYMCYFHRGREFTLEISDRKLVRSEDLPTVWNHNRASLINYMASALYGLRGNVVDCITGLPVRAEIIIPGFDIDNSSVFSEEETSNYYRYLDNGSYDFMVVAESYDTLYFTAAISDKQSTRYDIELCPKDLTYITETEWQAIQVNYIANNLRFENLPQGQKFQVDIYSTSGVLIQSSDITNGISLAFNPANSGLYMITIRGTNESRSSLLFIN